MVWQLGCHEKYSLPLRAVTAHNKQPLLQVHGIAQMQTNASACMVKDKTGSCIQRQISALPRILPKGGIEVLIGPHPNHLLPSKGGTSFLPSLGSVGRRVQNKDCHCELRLQYSRERIVQSSWRWGISKFIHNFII